MTRGAQRSAYSACRSDEDMRRFLVKALEEGRLDIISFGDGLEAYERLKEEPFTLLFTDIVMPEIDGIELARKASELDPDSSHVHRRLRRGGLNPDSHAPKDAKILSKPFHLRDLVDRGGEDAGSLILSRRRGLP